MSIKYYLDYKEFLDKKEIDCSGSFIFNIKNYTTLDLRLCVLQSSNICL